MRGVGCARLRRAGAGESGERRSGQRRETAERRGRGRRERDSIADGTALRNIVGEEVAATFGDTEDLFPEGSFRGHYPMYTSSNAVWLKVHGHAPLSPRIENYWGPWAYSKDIEIIVRAQRDKNPRPGVKNPALHVKRRHLWCL